VARGFTEAMGGTLHAEPTPGGGLTMVITLPADPTAPAIELATVEEAMG
jgi:two-component system, OmpR family, sensor histidine kinase KdpD